MSNYSYKFRVEMRTGQDMRMVEADLFKEQDGWLIFYRRPPVGGTQEYWRTRLAEVVSMETVRP